MPPKKGRKKAKTATVIHGVVTSEMSKEEIEKYVVLLRDELDRERMERNMLALERNKVTTFWELSKRQTDDARCMLRKKERELEDAEERHQMEMRIYRQKVKHMLFEQNSKASEMKKETSVTLNAMSDETRVEVRKMQNENYTLKAQLRYKQLESEEAVKMLKRQHETEMTNIRQEFIVQAEEMEQRAAKQAAELRENLETKRIAEIHATEERKNLHIKQLELAHDKAFTSMKSYYNDVTLGNVNVIKTLRENIEELRTNLTRTQHKLEESASETLLYKERLVHLEKINKHLTKVAHQYSAEKTAHNITKANLKRKTEAKQSMDMQFNIVDARLQAMEKQKDSLVTEMELILMQVKEKTGLRCAMLEQKLSNLVHVLEARETQIHEMVIAMNSDPAAVTEAKMHLETILENKNSAINELQYEVLRVGKAYKDLWRACQQKLTDELSQPVNLGIRPVEMNANLTSPFHPATAHMKLLAAALNPNDNSGPNEPIEGRGPTGLTSVSPL